MKLFIVTQYRENYGAHNWDGVGNCPQYWKNKGGITRFVQLPDGFNDVDFEKISKKACADVTRYNDYVEEYVINFYVEADDHLTPDEQDQLEYEGVIRYRTEEVGK